MPEIQLYHMGEDPAESDNTQADQSAMVSELTQELHRVVVGHENDPSVAIQDWSQIVWRSELPKGFILDDRPLPADDYMALLDEPLKFVHLIHR